MINIKGIKDKRKNAINIKGVKNVRDRNMNCDGGDRNEI